MTPWQPIETAPKDGTRILAFGSKMTPEIYVLKWVQFSMNDDREPTGRRVFSEFWCEAGGEQYEEYRPTHWMPLPEPPK